MMVLSTRSSDRVGRLSDEEYAGDPAAGSRASPRRATAESRDPGQDFAATTEHRRTGQHTQPPGIEPKRGERR